MVLRITETRIHHKQPVNQPKRHHRQRAAQPRLPARRNPRVVVLLEILRRSQLLISPREIVCRIARRSPVPCVSSPSASSPSSSGRPGCPQRPTPVPCPSVRAVRPRRRPSEAAEATRRPSLMTTKKISIGTSPTLPTTVILAAPQPAVTRALTLASLANAHQGDEFVRCSARANESIIHQESGEDSDALSFCSGMHSKTRVDHVDWYEHVFLLAFFYAFCIRHYSTSTYIR